MPPVGWRRTYEGKDGNDRTGVARRRPRLSDTYALGGLWAVIDGYSRALSFESGWIRLEMPGPSNLKSWSVEVIGVDADGMDVLEHHYYNRRQRVILEMITGGGHRLWGEADICRVAVGPRARATFSGIGFLEGFESL